MMTSDDHLEAQVLQQSGAGRGWTIAGGAMRFLAAVTCSVKLFLSGAAAPSAKTLRFTTLGFGTTGLIGTQSSSLPTTFSSLTALSPAISGSNSNASSSIAVAFGSRTNGSAIASGSSIGKGLPR